MGTLHHIDENRGFGYMTVREGLHVSDVRTDVFLHINEIRTEGRGVTMPQFLEYKLRESLIEFTLVVDADGKARAVDAIEFRW